MATSAPTPETAAFWTSSKPIRPLTSITGTAGERPASTRAPMTLSRALWRPMSSRTSVSVPSASTAAAACRPPVVLKTRWCSRSRSGSAESSSGERTGCAAAASVRAAARGQRQHLVDALGAAHPAGRRGGQQGGGAHARGCERRRGQGDGDDVELLLGSQRHVGAVGDLRQLGAGQDALAGHHPGRELEVVARRAHGDADPLGGVPGPGQADLQRLLGGQPVLATLASGPRRTPGRGRGRWVRDGGPASWRERSPRPAAHGTYVTPPVTRGERFAALRPGSLTM